MSWLVWKFSLSLTTNIIIETIYKHGIYAKVYLWVKVYAKYVILRASLLNTWNSLLTANKQYSTYIVIGLYVFQLRWQSSCTPRNFMLFVSIRVWSLYLMSSWSQEDAVQVNFTVLVFSTFITSWLACNHNECVCVHACICYAGLWITDNC